MKKLLSAALFLGAAFAFTSCEKDSDNGPSYDLSKGLIIVNEGIEFGSISHYNPVTDAVTNDIFKTVNNREVGKYLQSVCSYGDNIYLVVGGSAKVEVINRSTSREVATISGIGTPRYMVTNGATGYVSAWDNKEVAVINLTTSQVTGSIKVGAGPEGLLIHNGNLFVANSGGFATDNSISVIDLKSNTIVKTITVENNPKTLVLDKNNNIWVVCAGYATKGALCKINPSTYEVTKTVIEGFNPDRLQINSAKDKLYYGGTFGAPGIFQMDIAAATAPTKPFISGDFYGFAINPSNEEVMAMVAPYDANDKHKMVRYNTNGEKIKEYSTKVYPNGGIFFN